MNFMDCTLTRKNGNLFAATESLQLKIPSEQVAAAEGFIGQKVVLGIRPEHMTDVESVSNPEPDHSFGAKVRVIESAGSEKLVHIRAGEDLLIARLDPHVRIKTGDICEFQVRMQSAHLFDPESGKTIF
jgi:multiple sugar transport system ATP-binding protein